jgi:hypothetical protein
MGLARFSTRHPDHSHDNHGHHNPAHFQHTVMNIYRIKNKRFILEIKLNLIFSCSQSDLLLK